MCFPGCGCDVQPSPSVGSGSTLGADYRLLRASGYSPATCLAVLSYEQIEAVNPGLDMEVALGLSRSTFFRYRRIIRGLRS